MIKKIVQLAIISAIIFSQSVPVCSHLSSTSRKQNKNNWHEQEVPCSTYVDTYQHQPIGFVVLIVLLYTI